MVAVRMMADLVLQLVVLMLIAGTFLVVMGVAVVVFSIVIVVVAVAVVAIERAVAAQGAAAVAGSDSDSSTISICSSGLGGRRSRSSRRSRACVKPTWLPHELDSRGYVGTVMCRPRSCRPA